MPDGSDSKDVLKPALAPPRQQTRKAAAAKPVQLRGQQGAPFLPALPDLPLGLHVRLCVWMYLTPRIRT